MPGLFSILQHTPWWVFALFALLLVLGVQALRPRTITMWRLLVIPGIFIGWGIVTLAARSIGSPVLLWAWLVACAAGMAIAWQTTRLDGVTVDRGRGLVTVPASAFPLVRNLVIFVAKYCLAAAVAIAPVYSGSLFLWDISVSGLAAGYFIGWLLRFSARYRSAREFQAAGLS